MAIKLDTLSPKQLDDLIKQANQQKSLAQTKLIGNVRSKIDALLASNDLTLADVYPAGGKPGKGARGGVRGKRKGSGIPKYRNPADPSQTWTGFGKKPMWFVSAIKKPGITADSLLIAGRKSSEKVAPKTAKRRGRKKVVATRKKPGRVKK
jgi:DNA-binding protein H-NS